jgi:hypothetical protein
MRPSCRHSSNNGHIFSYRSALVSNNPELESIKLYHRRTCSDRRAKRLKPSFEPFSPNTTWDSQDTDDIAQALDDLTVQASDLVVNKDAKISAELAAAGYPSIKDAQGKDKVVAGKKGKAGKAHEEGPVDEDFDIVVVGDEVHEEDFVHVPAAGDVDDDDYVKDF